MVTAADEAIRLRAPDGVVTDADRALLRTHKSHVLALLKAECVVTDPAAAVIISVFGSGTRVVASEVPATWPPAGGSIPTSSAFDPFTVTPPAGSCRCCGSAAWQRAGTGWTYGRCHPVPGEPEAANRRRGSGVLNDPEGES
jgi:hypothetical protein